MNWFQQNRWLGTFLIVVGVLTIGALFFLFSAKSHSDEELARFQEAVNEETRLASLDPFPERGNVKKMEGHLKNYSEALNKLKEELKTRVPAPAPLAPNEFQSKLRQAMIAVTVNNSARKVSPALLKVWTAAIIASRALISSSSPRSERPVSASTSGQDAMKPSSSSAAAALMAACLASLRISEIAR